MRRWLLLLMLFALPSALAATHSDWHYSGDTFKVDNVIYGVQGFGDDKILLSVAGRSYVLMTGECVTQPLESYCFTKRAAANDTAHIKYAGGKELIGYYIVIDVVKPKVTVERTFSNQTFTVDESVDVTLKIKNDAPNTIENVNFTEVLPQGITSGQGARVSQVYKSISPGDTQYFMYTLRPSDFVNGTLNGTVTYRYAGQQFNATLTSFTFKIATPLQVKTTVNSSLYIDQVGNFSINLTNMDKHEPIEVRVEVPLPEDVRIIKMSGFNGTSMLAATFTLEPEEQRILAFSFTPRATGNLNFTSKVIATYDGKTFTRTYPLAVSAKADKLTAAIATSKTSYRSGDTITVTATLENVNAATTFQQISGKLSAPGLLENKTFEHEAFPPKRTFTEVEEKIVLPDVNASKQYTISFTGQYMTPGGEQFTFTTNKQITVTPSQQLVEIKRTIEPAKPTPGGNVTVTVRVKNLAGKYAGVSAYELYDKALTRSEGTTTAEVDLQKDEEKQLYIYRLTIPKDYAKEFNLTTEATVKNEGSQRAVTTVYLANITPAANNTTAAVNPPPQPKPPQPEPVKKKGFWGEVWGFLKGLL